MEQQHSNDESNNHGSPWSYIIGFALSLIFTIVPYYMVVMKQSVTGSTLVVIVIGIAIIQMFVQLFFFLHLGRGPKPLYNVVFSVATAVFITVIVGASLIIMDNLYHNMSPDEVTRRLAQEENIAEIGGKETGACQVNNKNHVMTITSTGVTPNHVMAQRCDTISFVSGDGAGYMIIFGPHDAPTSYGGLYEVSIRGTRSEVVTLNETGNFNFHVMGNEDITGIFMVEP